MARFCQVKNFKRQQVFFLISAVIHNILIGQVVFQLKIILIFWFYHRKHPFTDKTRADESQHRPELFKLDSFSLFVAVVLEGASVVMEIFLGELESSVTLLLPVGKVKCFLPHRNIFGLLETIHNISLNLI